MEKRIEYLEELIKTEKSEKGRGYFINQGISLSLENIKAFTSSLQAIFLQTGITAKIIGNLANLDIRRCLDLTRELIASPYIHIEDLLKAHIDKNTIEVSMVTIKRALIKGKYDIYPSGQSKFVQNIFALHTEIDTSPLLGLRVLQLLRDSYFTSPEGLVTSIETEQVIEYLRAMTFEPKTITLWLDAMLKTGLCLSYDPTVTSIDSAKKIEISPSGQQHLYWGLQDKIYIESMLYVTPIFEQETYHSLDALYRSDEIKDKRTSCFIEYLLLEDCRHCIIPDHIAYKGQLKITKAMEYLKRKLNITQN